MSKIIIIKLVEKKDSWNKFQRYSNTKDYITPYFDETGIYTGLTKTQEEDFSKRLGGKDLSRTSGYWDDYKVIMTDKPMMLNLDNTDHELAYNFLLGHKRVAQSITDPHIGNKDYYIVDDNKEAEVVMKKASEEIKASKIFSELSTQNKKDILRLYPGFVTTSNVSDSTIDSKLYLEMKKDPMRFILHAEDKKRDMKVFIKDLTSADILRKNKSSFYYGDDFIGHDEETAINYIEDPARQSLKIDLMAQLGKSTKVKK